MENLQTRKQYYVPMEVNTETIKDFGVNPEEVTWTKIGNKKVRAIMIPVTEEQYRAYMRPLWREDKRLQRQEPQTSLDALFEATEYESIDLDTDLEADYMKKLLIAELHKALDELEEVDRKIMELYSQGCSEAEIGKAIGMSQRGAGKRKQRILLKLRDRLEEYR